MIRILRTGLMKDLIEEVRGLVPTASEAEIARGINPTLTFKFSRISDPEKKALVNWARKENLVSWAGDDALILSFYHRKQVDSLQQAGREFAALNSLADELSEFLRRFETRPREIALPSGRLSLDRPLIMGILNVTPDSFSDGGKYLTAERAVAHALEMVAEGADVIDLGAESTRPGAEPVSLEEEWRRLRPVLQNIRQQSAIPLSVDTYKAEIARRALQEGADIVNDISGLTFDPAMAPVVAQAGVPVIVMHIKGSPKNMQKNPIYRNLMEEVYEFLGRQVEFARQHGIRQVIIDPGIGFGKRWEDNFELIRRLEEFRGLGCPILLGPSRKSFIGNLLDLPPEERVPGTVAACAVGSVYGADIFRVHDVREVREAVLVARAIQQKKA